MALILAEAAISTAKRYADDLEQAGTPRSNAYLSPSTLDVLDAVLPWFYGMLLAVMVYQKAIDERKLNRVLINEMRDQGLISRSSAKTFKQSQNTIGITLTRISGVAAMVLGGTYIADRDKLLNGLFLIGGSSVFDGTRAYLESAQWRKLWNANFQTKYRSHDDYAFQRKLQFLAVVPAVIGFVLCGYMISGLRDQRDGDENKNDYITQSIFASLAARQTLINLWAWPCTADTFEVMEAIVRESEQTRDLKINTTKLFGMRMDLSTAYQVLDFLSKGSIVAASALYTFQAQHPEDEFFPKASLALMAGLISANFMATWNKVEGRIAGQINAKLRDKFTSQTATAFVSDNVGRAVEYVSETTVVKTVVNYLRPKSGLSTPLLQPGERSLNEDHDYGQAVRRNEV